MGSSNAGATGKCLNPTAVRGAVAFNSNTKRLIYCNGTTWMNAGNWGPPPACTGGYTWTDQAGAGSRNWRTVASSSDGSKLAAGVYSG
jgi:hypothetical protein